MIVKKNPGLCENLLWGVCLCRACLFKRGTEWRNKNIAEMICILGYGKGRDQGSKVEAHTHTHTHRATHTHTHTHTHKQNERFCAISHHMECVEDIMPIR